MSGREHFMAPADAARLHMSVPENPMIIVAALVLGAPLGREELVALLDARVIRVEPRFRRRVAEPALGLGRPRWADDERFDLRAHVSITDARPLVDVVEELARAPLARDRPLWSAHLVPAVGTGCAIVLRVHHCIADGAALVALLHAIADEPDAPEPLAPRPSTRLRRAPTPRERALAFVRGAVDAARFALPRREPRTSLRVRAGIRKRFAFSAPIAVDALSAAAHAMDGTITDVLLAAVSGALRALLVRKDGRAPRRRLVLHALVPVNVRAGASSFDSGNRFASVFVPLPVGVADPRERARRIDRALRAVRARGVGAGLRAVAAAGVATAAIERAGVALLSRKATVTISSVRGPARPLHIGGAPLDDVLVWVPAPGSIGVSVSLLSYAGRARIGVAVDARLEAEPAELCADLEREIRALASPGAACHRGCASSP